jgi:hypothetical protein
MKAGGKRLLCLALILAAMGGLASVYLARRPLVIVMDDAFLSLYGEKRADTKRRLLCATLFRRVQFAVIALNAGRDEAGLAVRAAAKDPYLVLFPQRYLESAERYALAARESGAQNKSRIVVLESGAGGGVYIGEAESMRIDRETDLYRAGRCAAILARGQAVAFFYQGALPEPYKEAFADGLVSAGNDTEPLFYRYTETLRRPEETGCIVLFSAINASAYEVPRNTPVILFSWMNPQYTPNGVQVVFDDSPLAAAAHIARGLTELHAEAQVLAKRTAGKDARASLKAAVRAVRQENQSEEERQR